MNKSKFKKYMEELIELKDAEDDLNNALRKIDKDFNYICFSRHELLILNLLKEVMDDNDDTDWIGYWIYELDCGKKAKENYVTIDGKNTPIKTIDNLYDILDENRNNSTK